MKKYISQLIIFFSFISVYGYSQETNTTLVCSGKYSNYSQNLNGIDVNSDVITFNKSIVRVEVFGFSNGDSLDYKVLKYSDSKITFRYTFDDKKIYFGSLNRYSGELNLSQPDNPENPTKMEQLFVGKCMVSKKRF
jgi:hypothetical protein